MNIKRIGNYQVFVYLVIIFATVKKEPKGLLTGGINKD
ncbi:hypothetical protein PISS_a1046 [Pseudoalteromonas issachenkonii]|uniref:Uncharacterized protein n=1 Tax=Pseudoalteromonas issachenkonii TaxID=152297 RepID=A0ABN5C1B7_9GAMM|nr:hypothetical protein PISS_a1046 [Pseudoalteromonas issachenkonii]